MNSIETKFIFFRGAKIAYYCYGYGDSLIVIPGYSLTTSAFFDFVSGFAGFNFILIDLPGCGNSAYFRFENFNILAQMISEIISTENISQFSLIGHSMGGYIALEVALLLPKNYKKVFLINSHPFSDTEEIIRKRLHEIDLIKQGKRLKIMELGLPMQFAVQNRIRLEKEIFLIKKAAAKIQDEVCINYILAIIRRQNFNQAINMQHYRKWNIFWGFFDKLKWEMLNENIKIFELLNSAHYSFLEEPEILTKQITDILKKTSN